MFPDLIKMIMSLLVPIIAGYALIISLVRQNRISKFLLLPTIYGLGIGILSQWMLILGVMKIPLTRNRVGIPLLVISLALIILREIIRKHWEPFRKHSPKFFSLSLPLKFLIVIVIIILGFKLSYIFFQALNIPIYSWDAMYVSAYRAKVIFHQKSLVHMENFPHPSYPFLIQFAEAWVSLNLGRWHDQYAKIIFPLFSLSFLLITYGFISSYTNRIWGLLSCFLLTTSNLFVLHSTICYRDLTLMFYISGAIIFILLWNKHRNDGFLYIASLFTGFATFTKLEGSAYFLLSAILFFLLLARLRTEKFAYKFSKFLKFLIPAGGIFLFFSLYKIYLGIPTERLNTDFCWEHMNRIPIILRSFYDELFFSADWGITWFILVLSLILNFSKIRKEFAVKFLLIALVLFFGFYFFYSLLTPNFIWISGEAYKTTLPRIILHFFPLTVWIIALLNYQTIRIHSHLSPPKAGLQRRLALARLGRGGREEERLLFLKRVGSWQESLGVKIK